MKLFIGFAIAAALLIAALAPTSGSGAKLKSLAAPYR